MQLQQNLPLAPLTTFRIGGPARFFVEARSTADVAESVHFAQSENLPLFILGGGSNLLVSDAGWPGLVLKIGITGIDERQESGKLILEAGAGEDWDGLVSHAVARNCAGVECLSGIPGNVGGTPVQNVGAYGQEVSETIASVLVFDLKDGQVRELCNEACGFAYRSSIFNTTERGRFIILRVTYNLTPGGEPLVRYADLQKYFSAAQKQPSLSDVRQAVRTIRASKGMLIVPDDPDSRSAGSFFKNPVLTEAQYRSLCQQAAAKDLQVPAYPALEQHKVSAAWLVEHSGFAKGYGLGKAGISSKHSLAIVNRRDAAAADVLALKELIQEKVRREWNVELQPEPVLVGFAPEAEGAAAPGRTPSR